MGIERNQYGFDGEITFNCDKCSNECHTDETAFDDALAVMKKEGWINRKDEHGEWEHICHPCIVKENTELKIVGA